ncbi:hypothetical protein CSUNSWCD_6 [Campylobacter showae CSUNSWCD]|uniref:Uncharacterized protein n=1 Tax=Campylobacter showae CSUNSWCD TaxID=1244083 RepID=M5IRY2_9BACT|nr:hypothetical protein CSUNSWCD_6 [Campylobacter showae CSUNSWCD]
MKFGRQIYGRSRQIYPLKFKFTPAASSNCIRPNLPFYLLYMPSICRLSACPFL